MLYSINISTPASTTQADPVETTILITVGVVHRVKVGFPPGPQTDLHVAIDRGNSQVWPSGASLSWAWDDYVFDMPEFYEVEVEPLEFVVRTWNDDASFAHECMVQLEILPRDVLLPESPAIPLLERMSRVLFGGRR